MGDGVRELKEKAQALLLKHRYPEAVALLHEVVELAADDAFAIKKLGETYERLGEHEAAADHYLRLSSLLEAGGHRLQAITCCKLATQAFPAHAAAKALLAKLYAQNATPSQPFQLQQQSLSRGPVAPPHTGSPAPASPASAPPPAAPPLAEGASEEMEFASAELISTSATKDVEIFLDAFLGLCASFAGTVLTPQPQALTESVTGNTDFLWLIQFTGAVEHTVVISAQRRFIVGLTTRVFDIDEAVVTDAMATKLSNKLIGMYIDDVKRAFAANERVVQSGPAIPVAGHDATYQLSGIRALHVPLSSEIGWAQVTIAGGI